MIFENPGIKVISIYNGLSKEHPTITVDQIRNSIKRKIYRYIEYRGSKKTGGYFFKK